MIRRGKIIWKALEVRGSPSKGAKDSFLVSGPRAFIKHDLS